VLENLAKKRINEQETYRGQINMKRIKPIVIMMGLVIVMGFSLFSTMTIKAAPTETDNYATNIIEANLDDGLKVPAFDVPLQSIDPVNIGSLNYGVACQDGASGTGYIMYSVADIGIRFAARPNTESNNADHFICVRHDGTNWQYDTNSTYVSFLPAPNDVLVAAVDYSNDTVSDLAGTNNIINGISLGYVSGDMVFTANQWNGASNSGEFGISGTSFVPNHDLSWDANAVSILPRNSGVACQDGASGTGFILYSATSVHTRFSAHAPHGSNADHFICVKYNGSDWVYDNNSSYYTFTPSSSDVLVASVDFSADIVSDLVGANSIQNGINYGYETGDLTFLANRWGTSSNGGEFNFLGTAIVPNQTVITAALDKLELSVEKTVVDIGEAIDTTVTAIDAAGAQATSYVGTIQFSSTDSLAALPAHYTFTSGIGFDNGSHIFVDGVSFNTPGQQVITVTDTISPSLVATSTVMVRDSGPAVSLQATISPTTAFAGENILQLTVEALDAQGRRAGSYRGSIELVESASSTLPARSGSIAGNAPDYTFTEADAGVKTFTFAFNEGGLQDVYVYDYYNSSMNTTSNQVDVKEVYLWAEITPGEAFAGEPALVLAIEARDEFGVVWPGYRGQVELVESVASTLPSVSGSLKNVADYTFTAANAGRATFTFAFNYSGMQNVRVYDWANSARDVTSNSVDVKEVYLWAEISPTVAIAGDAALTLTVEARDELGNIWPDYRGYIELVESAPSTLPSRSGSLKNTWDYQFTEANAGRATFNFAYNSGGVHNVYIYDWVNSGRNVTTNNVEVSEIYLTASISPTTAIRGDEDFILLVEARDENGDLYPHYRGNIEFVPSASATLPDNKPPCCGDYADYTFTAADGGSASLPFAFNETGTQNVYVYDHVNGNRNATSNNVTVTEPPPPTPAPPTAPPPGYGVPQGLEPGGTIPYGFGLPVMAVSSLPSNSWQGYPDYKIPASEGAFYLSAGFSHRAINDFGWATYYTVNYLGWENPLTDQRSRGGGTDGGPAAGDDYAFSVQAAGNTWPISHGPSSLGLTLSGIAPANTEGVHLDVHAGGNAGNSPFVIGSNGGYSPASCNSETVSVGDPIDTRSGGFYLVERDFGVSTGCQGIDLRFERVYLSQSLLSDTPFGYGWTHNYNQEVITLSQDYVAVRRPRGEHLIFKDVGTDVYASFAGSPHMLVKRPEGGWALVDQDQYADLFDADGKLIAQQDPNGNMVWLTYETATRGSETVTRLARVDAPGGRYLWFGYDYYDIDELTQVADHTGRTVQYDYDVYGFLDVVTNTMDAATTYDYNNLTMVAV